MNAPLQSPNWYRVRDLTPRLRDHVRIHRQQFRGDLWYVLQDRTSGRHHRFTPAGYLLASLMNGERSMQKIWELACARLGAQAPTQDDVLQLLSQLYDANVLLGGNTPDIGEVRLRADRVRRMRRVMGFLNPLAVRIPVVDPDNFLEATAAAVLWVFSAWGLLIFATVVVYAGSLAGQHWAALTGDFGDRVLSADNLLLLVLSYPFVKLWHELGHAYAVKRWGGEVHEIGVMFLVFIPVPYVDASDASTFASKWQRALVGAMGILVEVFLAALALLVWIEAEDGLVRAFAFNIMLIGGVSTLLFNGNPLLRFDGYYVLADLLEIPNLGTRSTRYLGYLIQRYVFAVPEARSPATARGEPAWFVSYALASFCYRMFIMFAIVMFVATQFFVVGVVLAIWSVALMLALPMLKLLRFLFTSPVLGRRRGRAIAMSFGFVAALAAGLLLVPLPHATVAEGVVWTRDEAAVFAGADGIVERVLAQPSTVVHPGQILIELSDPLLEVQVRALDRKVAQLAVRYQALEMDNPVEAKLLSHRLRHARADLARAEAARAQLEVKSTAAGHWMLPGASDLQGRFVRKGQVLGYVSQLDHPAIRVIVHETDAELVRSRVRAVELRFVDRIGDVHPARVVRQIPALSDALPSLALSTFGGGAESVDPSNAGAVKALAKLLHLEVQTLDPVAVHALGGRVFVRFDHGYEAAAWRLYRAARQIFLKRLNV